LIQLPDAEPMAAYPALAAIADSDTDLNVGGQLTLAALSTILFYSAGITREKRSPGGTIAFRAAACAGALYPIEVYVISGNLDSLPAGVYHFNPRDRALVPLRQGDCSAALVHSAAGLPDVAAASAVLVFTAISWRSSWKYRSRAYRYHYWDNGTMLANTLAVCTALSLSSKLAMGFIDDEISRLVGIDGRAELPLSLLAIGSRPGAAHSSGPDSCPDLPALNLETVPLSPCQIEYPLIQYMHLESSLADVEQVRNWRYQIPDQPGSPATGGTAPGAAESTLVPLRPHSVQTLVTDGIGDVILRRASTRRFARKPISFEDLSTIIDRSTRGLACDFAPGGIQLNDVYIIVNRIDGLASGAYYYRRDEKSLELLKQGEFSADASYLTLEQDLGGDSSATLFYMADLDRVLSQLGNRGYRSAQIEAGIIGGRAYLAAYALGRGATGLTFYDDDVTAFFSPHAAGKSCTLVVAIGVPGRQLGIRN
jgi:SagB-type dehydrogenase family enzyme